MTKDEALKLALEALHGFIPYLPLNDEAQCGRYDKAITAIKEALAQPETWEKFCDSNCVWTDHHPDCKLAEPEQEPDYYGLTADHLWMSISKDHYDRLKPEYRMACYTTPPQRKPLTDEEIRRANHHMVDEAYDYSFKQGVKWAEYKHGIKGEA